MLEETTSASVVAFPGARIAHPDRVNAVYRQRYHVVPTTADHIGRLAPLLRPEDIAEVTGSGNNVKRSLWRGFRHSILCETAIIDGEVAAMWGLCISGIVGASPLGDLGRPWLLTSALVEKIPFGVVRESKRAVSRMLTVKPILENQVLSSYTRAVRMLRMVGFTVDEPAPRGPHAILYSRFHLTRQHG